MNTTNNPNLDLTGKRILIAEDNPAVRAFIVRALSGMEADIQDVPDGQKALDVLKENAFDVLISDIVMPHVDGIALALEASTRYPELKIVMISGYAQERMRANNLETLAHKIIAKPFSLEEICIGVKDVLSIAP